MRRGITATAIALAGLLVGVALVLVAAASEDPPPTVVASSDAVDPADYAAAVTGLCTDRRAAAEEAGYEASAAGADEMAQTAAALAAIPPPAGGRPMAQALVDGLDRYADLFARRDDNQEAFSQAQNELVGVLEVRALGLGASCGEQSSLGVPEPADPDDLAGLDDPSLEQAAGACYEGDLRACDELRGRGTALTGFGATCAGRLVHEEADENIGCVESFASDRPVGDQP